MQRRPAAQNPSKMCKALSSHQIEAVVGARGRCCPAASVPVAVVFACGACCCIDEEIQNKIIDRKTELRHHRPPSKATSTRTTHTRVSKMGFWVCGSGGVFESCTFYLHDGRANRGCRMGGMFCLGYRPMLRYREGGLCPKRSCLTGRPPRMTNLSNTVAWSSPSYSKIILMVCHANKPCYGSEFHF